MNDDAALRAFDRAVQIGLFHPGQGSTVCDNGGAGAENMVWAFCAVVFDKDVAGQTLIVRAFQNVARGQCHGLPRRAHLRIFSISRQHAVMPHEYDIPYSPGEKLRLAQSKHTQRRGVLSSSGPGQGGKNKNQVTAGRAFAILV